MEKKRQCEDISSWNSEILTSEKGGEEAAKFVSSPKTILSGGNPSFLCTFSELSILMKQSILNKGRFLSIKYFAGIAPKKLLWKKTLSFRSNQIRSFTFSNPPTALCTTPAPTLLFRASFNPGPLQTRPHSVSADISILLKNKEHHSAGTLGRQSNSCPSVREISQLTFLMDWTEIFNNHGCGLKKKNRLLHQGWWLVP